MLASIPARTLNPIRSRRGIPRFSLFGNCSKQQKGGLLGNSIKWNFTKFLVDRAGTVRARFAPTTKPESLARDVAELL